MLPFTNILALIGVLGFAEWIFILVTMISLLIIKRRNYDKSNVVEVGTDMLVSVIIKSGYKSLMVNAYCYESTRYGFKSNACS